MGDLNRRIWLQMVVFVPCLALLLLAPAGTLWFWQAWVYGAILVAAPIWIGVYFLKHDPALIERRIEGGPTAEQEPAQKIIIALLVTSFFPLLVVPGFDHRWHWSTVPPWLVFVADGVVALSNVIFFVVVKQNRYAAATITVEADQPVVSTGLYGIVRHPMYAGGLLLLAFTPLALGSYWTLLFVIPTVPVLAWRVLDEERFLTRSLRGYTAYCRQVRYRLIPGVW